VSRANLYPGLIGLEAEVFEDALPPSSIAQEMLPHFLA
jgi:hypothetical protein